MLKIKRIYRTVLFLFPIFLITTYKIILGFSAKEIIGNESFNVLFVTSFLFMFFYVRKSVV